MAKALHAPSLDWVFPPSMPVAAWQKSSTMSHNRMQGANCSWTTGIPLCLQGQECSGNFKSIKRSQIHIEIFIA